MSKKGSSTSRKRSSRGVRDVLAGLDRLAAAKPAFFLETIAGDRSEQKDLLRCWRGIVYGIQSDLRRIRAGATANIPRRVQRILRAWARQGGQELERAGLLIELVAERLAYVGVALRCAQIEFDSAETTSPPPPKKSRSQKATTSTGKSQ